MSDNHDMRGSTTGRLAELSDNDARCRPTHLHQSAGGKNASLCPGDAAAGAATLKVWSSQHRLTVRSPLPAATT